MTDTHRPEIALHFQPEWCRVTLASIGDAVITTDTQGRVTFLNSVAESLTGWTSEAATGQPLQSVFRIINEQSRRPVESPTVRALRDGVIVGLANHSLLIAKDGVERPIDDSAAPIRDGKGQVAGVVLVFRDISSRRLHEQQVQEALGYAETIIATLRQPLLVLDNDLRVLTANRSYCRTFHVTQEETENRFLHDLGDRQWDLAALRELLADVLGRNQPFDDFEVDCAFPEIGRRIMLLGGCRFERLDRDAHRAELMLLSIEDATERRLAEQRLKESESRKAAIIRAALDCIIKIDHTGRIVEFNPAAERTFGYRREDVLGQTMAELIIPPSLRERHRQAMAHYLATSEGPILDQRLELTGMRADGAEFPVELTVSRSPLPGPPMFIAFLRDITLRTRLERETMEQARELADLHRRKDEFLAMLSHELRNPLAPISNAVHLLRLQPDERPHQREARTIIERQVGQLTRLVDDLLEVSRITTGRIRLDQQPVAVSGVVERSVETVRSLLEQRGHQLTVSLPDQPIWLHADPARLDQVVVNLLTNAAKYTDPGGRIWLTVAREGDEAVLRVRDTGVGIDPELLPRIFDLFTQAENSLDRSQGGLGIGLCLVQRLVEMHGGSVHADSTVGQGSEFVIRLPIAQPAPQAPSPGAPTSQAAPRSLRVLVVDDNVDLARSLASLLKASGHDVRTAHDGPRALEAAREFRPNAVLLDIGLPGMNGFEVAQRMRQEPILQNVVLVAMTGYGQETDRQRSQAAGFDHHLLKPADFALVQQVLATVRESPA